MNKNIQKFEEAYLSIINEDADKKYHNIRWIIEAVKAVTNNCQDLWIKGKSGTDVLNYMDNPGNGEGLYPSDFELKYIANYWKGKANSGNKFDTDMASEIGKAVDETLSGVRFPHAFLRFKIGIIAYGVWKALNVKQKKEANNRAEIENSNVDQEYANISNKKLKLVDWKIEYSTVGSYWSHPVDWRFICQDENGFKVNVKVRAGDKVGCSIIELLHYSLNLEISKEDIINKFGLSELTIIKAELGRINKEYKTIYLNRSTIEYPSNLSTIEAVETAKNQVEDEIKAKEEAKEMDKLNSENSHWKLVEIISDLIKEDFFKQKSKEDQINWLNHNINEILLEKIKNKSQNIKDAIKEDLVDAIKEAFPNNYQEYVDIISF